MRLISRTFLLAGRLAGGASGLLHLFAASTLTIREVQAGVRAAWQSFNEHQDEVALGLAPWERDFVDRFIAPDAHVLVIGCGSGRDVLPLLERGCRVTGIDPADSALAVARRLLDERKLSANLIEGFIEDMQLEGQFDVALFSWFCYSYIPGSLRRIRALREVAAHVKPGGRIIITYPNMPRPHAFMIRLARAVGWLVRSDWRVEQGDYVARKRYQDREYYSFVHAFRPPEIERESAAAGLEVVYRRVETHEAVFVLGAPQVRG